MPKRLKKASYWKIITLHFDWGEYQNQVAIAKAVGCSQSTVSEALKRFDGEANNPCPQSLLPPNQDRRLGKNASAYMLALLQRQPDLYISEICFELHHNFGNNPSMSRVCRALKDHKYSYKVLERIARGRDAHERHNWRETLVNGGHENYVFIDESHFRNDTVRRVRGRSLRGTPARAVASLGRYQSLSLLAACTCTGMLIDACKSYENGVDHNILIEWATHHLLPNMPVGSVLVMDNASIHHDSQFKALLDAAILDPGCGIVQYLFLPPYSPDFNPIERCFAQIKAYLRRYQEIAVRDVAAFIQEALLTVTEDNLRRYYIAAGMQVPTLATVLEVMAACVCVIILKQRQNSDDDAADIVAALHAVDCI